MEMETLRLRSLVYLVSLFAIALITQSVIVEHKDRIQGLPTGFPAPVEGANVPILGVNVALQQYDDEELEIALARIAEGGFVWVRQPFIWSQIEPEPGLFDWSGPDRILSALAHHPQLRLVAVLDDRRAEAGPVPPPTDPDRFASFAGAFATRYGAQVNYYQIWDEPNLAAHWGGGPVSPSAYADLLARTSRAIRAADPEAHILLSGLAPTTESGPQNLSDVRYLEQLYLAGAAPYFDIVTGKPYGFDTDPSDRRVDEQVLNFSRLLLLRDVMIKYGDAGKGVWASHWGWNALPTGWTGAPSIWGQTDEATQATRTVAALARARAEWPWAGALILEHFQPADPPDDPRWGFALIGPDGTPRPIYRAVADWAATRSESAPVGGYPAHNPWATYEDGWRVGQLGADVRSDGSRASFRFEGAAIALTVRRGPYRAFLYVTVDGEPAGDLPRDSAGRAYVVLYDSASTIATVPLATNLPPGPHTVEITAEGGQGQWTLVDWRVGPERVQDGYVWKLVGLAVGGLVLGGLLVQDMRQLNWHALSKCVLAWPKWGQGTLAVGLTGLLWVSAGASWGKRWDSPWLIVSFLTLPALAALFALRLDLGLTLVACTAPFYLHPGSMYYRALSMPEVLVLLCGVGMAAQGKEKASGQKSPGSESKPTLNLLDHTVLLLMAAAGIAGLAANNWQKALFELRAVFLIPALYYSLMRLAPLDKGARWRLADGFVLGSVGVAAIGLVQYAMGRNVAIAEGGLPRLQSVYHSPNNVGLYLGRVWPLLIAVALWGKKGRRRTLYSLAIAPVTLGIALSFSRGALLLGLPAAMLMMGWQVKNEPALARRWRRAALTFLAIGMLALVPLLRMPRFTSMLDLQKGSTFFRLELWRSSLAIIRQRPWFGVGPGNFQTAYRTRYILPSAWQEFNLGHPHNIYLDHWTRMGILGVLAGTALQVTFWHRIRASLSPPCVKEREEMCPPSTEKGMEKLYIGLAGSMAALLAHGLVDNTLFFPDMALAFFLTLALVQ